MPRGGEREKKEEESWEKLGIFFHFGRSFLPFCFLFALTQHLCCCCRVVVVVLLLCCCCSQLVVESLLLLLLSLCLLCVCACVCFHSFVCHCCLPIEVRLCLPGENASRRQRCSVLFIFYCTTNLHALNCSNTCSLSLFFSLFAAAAPGQRQPVGWQ